MFKKMQAIRFRLQGLWNEIKKTDIEQDYEDFKFGFYYDCSEWRGKLPILFFVLAEIKWFCQRIACVFLNHAWVDDSYGNPETGCMAGHCERCGYSFYERLY